MGAPANWLPLVFRAFLCCLIQAGAGAADIQPTLQSGMFGDERLILAVDPDSGSLSGYLHDNDCGLLQRTRLLTAAPRRFRE